MDHSELHARLMEEARRYDPADHGRGLLAPYRDVLLVWRAKAMSYEKIAANLTRHGLTVSPSGVGAFCRRNLAKAEILRERNRPALLTGGRPLAAAPSFGGLSAAAKPGPMPVIPDRRGPRIARDNY